MPEGEIYVQIAQWKEFTLYLFDDVQAVVTVAVKFKVSGGLQTRV